MTMCMATIMVLRLSSIVGVCPSSRPSNVRSRRRHLLLSRNSAAPLKSSKLCLDFDRVLARRERRTLAAAACRSSNIFSCASTRIACDCEMDATSSDASASSLLVAAPSAAPWAARVADCSSKRCRAHPVRGMNEDQSTGDTLYLLNLRCIRRSSYCIWHCISRMEV
eukprot:2971000-Prymnesium_polylepis.1